MSEIKLYYLNYSTNISEYYKKLCDLPGFVLLESSDRTRGRYDILSACPYDTVVIDQNTANVFSQLQEKIKPVRTDLDLPFQGGAIGYFSYNLACKIAGIDSGAQANLYDFPLLEVGLYDWAIITDHVLKKITVISANTQAETPAIIHSVLSKWEGASTKTSTFFIPSEFRPLISKAQYQEAFHAIHADIRRGRCYQVNYTQPFSTHYGGDPWEIYQAIKHTNPVPFGAYLCASKGNILSFSPERFVQMDQRMLFTSPIKGTQRRVRDKVEDENLKRNLQNCEKNRAENIMIVDLLRNDFGKIAETGSVQVTALCELESYQEVHHLVSHISAKCRDTISSFNAFNACFPGGSITGAPKLEAMRVIAEHETVSRGVYCGNIGYFSSHGRFDTNIAIRTIITANDELHLSAGGGLVIDSNCDDEYRECFTKIAGIMKGLR